ncbi:MAG: PEP-CTERM sorting domain-containing protein [Sedimentisphaerales bacterium]|nr:PEP-CTERM sorting domain-containing protein [Sedimentisphaerales bacterium]
MRKQICVSCLLMFLLINISNAANIDVGDWQIDVINNPVVDIPLLITGGEGLTDMVLRVQVADGGPEVGGSINGPALTAASFIDSIWEDASGGYVLPSTGIDPGDFPQIFEVNLSLIQLGDSVPADGILATITVDASEFGLTDIGSTFDLMLGGTLAGDTDFMPQSVDILIYNGSITLVPEPATLSLLALGSLALRTKRRK